MDVGAGLGGGGWVLPDPCSAEEELPKKEGVIPGGWDPHLLETPAEAENKENLCDLGVPYEEIIFQLKSKLECAEPDEVEEYVRSIEGNCTLLRWKLLSNLRKRGSTEQVAVSSVKVSDCPERGDNLLDGTDSEWWTSQETAWIELDLGRKVRVSKLKIQWWGTSVSKNYTVLAAGGDGRANFVERKTCNWITDTFQVVTCNYQMSDPTYIPRSVCSNT